MLLPRVLLFNQGCRKGVTLLITLGPSPECSTGDMKSIARYTTKTG